MAQEEETNGKINMIVIKPLKKPKKTKEALQKEQLSPAMLRENAQDQKIQAERLDELKEEIANLRSMLKHQQSSGVSYAQEIQPSKRKTTL